MNVSDPGRAEGKVKLSWLVLCVTPRFAQASGNRECLGSGRAQGADSSCGGEA